MASDLINRNQLLAEIYTEWLLVVPDRPVFICGELQRSERAKILEELMKMVEKRPTVDAVEVVRCEKCKYWKDKMYAEPLKGFCEIHEFCTENDEFCSWGSKMDGGDKE